MSNLLIDRQQNFVLNSKILSIDSDDRDITKWPNPANFEIRCPQSFNNVESIRLMNVNTPNNFYNISNYLQNKPFCFPYDDLHTIATHILLLKTF